MLELLSTLPTDPLLGLITRFKEDSNPQKIDLGVGVYRNEQGITPVLDCVKRAERHLWESEETKAYVGPMGNQAFTKALAQLMLGEAFKSLEGRLVGLQTPGGCGALHVLAALIRSTNPDAVIWASDPTWANHLPLLGGAGLSVKTYPYYDFSNKSILFEAMLDQLEKASMGDVVLLHACCHNPSGADLSQEQWRAVIALCGRKGLLPLIDIAYLGFGDSLNEDAFGVRTALNQLPEVMLAFSCSKNFGLYRERVGAAFVLGQNAKDAQIAMMHMQKITRGVYSMPPSHGASIVEQVMVNPELHVLWQNELHDMRNRIVKVRSDLVHQLSSVLGYDEFRFIAKQKGMFSFLGVPPKVVERLASEFGVYMAESSRMSLAGLNDANIPYFCEALKCVLVD